MSGCDPVSRPVRLSKPPHEQRVPSVSHSSLAAMLAALAELKSWTTRVQTLGWTRSPSQQTIKYSNFARYRIINYPEVPGSQAGPFAEGEGMCLSAGVKTIPNSHEFREGLDCFENS